MPPPKKTTLHDIAKQAGVSATTASQALRNHTRISLKTRDRVQKIAKELGYTPNSFAQGLAAQRSGKPGRNYGLACLVGHRDRNPLEWIYPYQMMERAARQRSKKLGMHLDTLWAYEPGLSSKRLDQVLKNRGINGILLLGILHKELKLDWKHYFCVYLGINRPISTYSYTSTDKYQLTDLAIQNIEQLGYKNVGLALSRHYNERSYRRIQARYEIINQVSTTRCESRVRAASAIPLRHQAPAYERAAR
ncbi:MAG: LacI family DNA-binding transcriptional regulator, partial [Verrucomicrobiota bacterium]